MGTIFWITLALTPCVLLVHYAFGVSGTPTFILSAAALAPLAFLIGEATEQIAEHTLAQAQRQVADAQQRVNAGDVAPSEVLKAQVPESQARAALARAKSTKVLPPEGPTLQTYAVSIER